MEIGLRRVGLRGKKRISLKLLRLSQQGTHFALLGSLPCLLGRLCCFALIDKATVSDKRKQRANETPRTFFSGRYS